MGQDEAMSKKSTSPLKVDHALVAKIMSETIMTKSVRKALEKMRTPRS
jgi:hypothetical protein